MITVIPAYEPDEKLIKLAEELLSDTDYTIVIVNDGSSQDVLPLFTNAESLSERVTVLHHSENRGKGAAMKTAFAWIKEQGYIDEGIVTVDADGQHLVRDVKRVCGQWAEHRDALVLGSRAFSGRVPFKSRFGNSITRGVFAISTGVRVYDTQTGLRAFSSDLLDEMLNIKGERYEYEINQLLTCTKRKIPIFEVTIDTVYIDKNQSSHFNALKDSWRIYKMIFVFMASSFISWIVDYALLLILSGVFARNAVDGRFMLFGMLLEPKLPALVIARIVSSLLNYVLNRKVVFESGSGSSIFKYYLVALVVLIANYGLLSLFTAAMPTWIAQILAQVILYPLNFVIQRKFVFKEKSRKYKEGRI